MGFMSFVCLCVATAAAAPSDPDQKKKRHSTSVGNSDEARAGLCCCGLRAWAWTNAPFTAAVQLAKDLNKQASTKYLEQPGLCLSVCRGFAFFLLPSLFTRQFLQFFCFCFASVLFFLQLLFNWTLEAELVELKSSSRCWVFCIALSFFRVPKCQTVPCRTCSAHSFL